MKVNHADWFRSFVFRAHTQDQGIRWFCPVYVQRSYIKAIPLLSWEPTHVDRYWVEKPEYWELLG